MFPEYLKFKFAKSDDYKITLYFETSRDKYRCPCCGEETGRHTTYFTRTIQDLPIIEKALYLNIRLKKFSCSNDMCSKKIFCESIDELVSYKGRRTNRLNDMMVGLTMANSAEGASKLLKYKNISVSGDTLLRLVKSWEPSIDYDAIESIGIDDFALKKTEHMEPCS